MKSPGAHPDDQAEVIAFLATPPAHGGAAVERIDTHAAVVFLAGTLARKLKRAVRFDYLDFSTSGRRRTMCEAEVRLNRRTAPGLYRGVTAVTREAHGALAVGGSGTPIDWLVEMDRFDQDLLFDRLAARGALDLDLMTPLARAVARFHLEAESRLDHGGLAGMRWVVAGNAAGFAEFGAGILAPEACRRVTDAAGAEIDRHGRLLDARRAEGYVRQCHGDLHLRNIVLLDGRPTPFDGVEFNDEIACVDVLYDLAFLLMDLWRRGLRAHANRVWNVYLGDTDDLDGLPLMPLFLSCRAAVRAKTSATASRLQGEAGRAGLARLAREYLEMAETLLRPPSPCLVAVGGFSGSGKSTLALGLAPSIGAVPGALVCRSDEIRKRLLGRPSLKPLGPEGYTAEVSRRVYAAVAERAQAALRAGYSVIADAVYGSAEDRETIERVAAAAGAPFAGLWLEAPESTLIDRTARRRNDPSDADAAVVRMQRARHGGGVAWHHVDAAGSAESVRGQAMTALAACRTSVRAGGERIA